MTPANSRTRSTKRQRYEVVRFCFAQARLAPGCLHGGIIDSAAAPLVRSDRKIIGDFALEASPSQERWLSGR